MVFTEKQFKICSRYFFFVFVYHTAKVAIICETPKLLTKKKMEKISEARHYLKYNLVFLRRLWRCAVAIEILLKIDANV